MGDHSAGVVNPGFVKALDMEMPAEWAERVRTFAPFEDHVPMGGFRRR